MVEKVGRSEPHCTAVGVTGTLNRVGKHVLCALLAGALFGGACYGQDAAHAQTTTATAVPAQLALPTYLSLVLGNNQSLQVRLLEFEVSRRRLDGERAIYEPDFVASYERQSNTRQNSREQTVSQQVRIFEDNNNIYNAGLEALIPTGARVRLGYSLRDLDNNIQNTTIFSVVPRGREFQSFGGLSLTQPLLKGGWNKVTTANIRLAVLGSQVAFQDYRKQLMTVVSTAEAAYWNLHLAQEQMRFFEESVKLAETLVKDGKTRAQAGVGSELEVLQSEAGLALRKSKHGEARQKYYEAVAQLRNLAGIDSGGDSPAQIQLLDAPLIDTVDRSFQDSGQKALSLNPDYVSQLRKAEQEDIRISYAKNQRLPQLDLKASYGLNGLAGNMGDSWDAMTSGDFESWSLGAELRTPIGGGRKSRNELQAARLRKKEALLGIQETENQVLNAIETALRKVKSTRESIATYQTVVRFNQDLLNTQMARLDVGKVEARKVLEVEADLFEAKNAVVEALIQHERSLLEIGFIEGSLLSTRHLDWPQSEVQEKTKAMIRQVAKSDERFREIMGELKNQYTRPGTKTP